MCCLQQQQLFVYPPNTIQAPKVKRVMNSAKTIGQNSTFQYTPPPPLSFTQTGCQPSPYWSFTQTGCQPSPYWSFTQTGCQPSPYWSFTHTSCQPSPSKWSICPYMSPHVWLKRLCTKAMAADCLHNAARFCTQYMGIFFWEFWVNGSTVTKGECTMLFGPVWGSKKIQMCSRKNEKVIN